MSLGGVEWIILFVICLVPLVLVAVLVGGLIWRAQVQARTTRKCPFCAERIKAEATVCRLCGREVPPAPVNTA